jgi:FkbM family methyltransferase
MRGTSRGGARGARHGVTLLLACVLAIPLAMMMAMPLALMLARQQRAGDPAERAVSALRAARGVGDPSALRALAQEGGSDAGGDGGSDGWFSGEAVSSALVGEGIRLEAVEIDVGKTRHYVSLCDASQPAAFLLGGVAAAEAPPRVHWRAIDKAAPIVCAAANIFMVDNRDTSISDDLLTYLFREEPWSIELWAGILSASRCRAMDGLKWSHACRANWGPYLAGRRPLVMDFGANHGFFGLFAGALGYDTVAVDPQPHCAEYVRTAAAAAELHRAGDSRFRTVNAFLAKDGALADGATAMDVRVRTGCWGTFPVGEEQELAVQKHFGKLPGGNRTVRVPAVDPMSLLGDPQADVVVLMKIDTEGAEFGILRALLPAMREGRILNILVEINKGVTEDDGKIHWPEWRHKGALWGVGAGGGGLGGGWEAGPAGVTWVWSKREGPWVSTARGCSSGRARDAACCV